MSTGRPLPGFEDRAPPDRYCDLILTGGVTSAIAYPAAIFALGTAYRFNSIGGSSSGAGTAALAAAAEYRRRHGSSDGFRLLLERTAEVADVKDGKTLLEWLFQPAADTRRLFAALVPGFASPVDKGKLLFLGLARVYGLWSLVPAVVVAIAMGWAVHQLVGLFAAATPATGMLVGASAVVALAIGWLLFAGLPLLIDLRRMVIRDYGLCTGYERSPGAPHPPLTEWLHGLIQEIAGRRPGEAPLTFNDLARAPGSPRDTMGGASPPGALSINLQMYTANLTHGRPYVFPQQRVLRAGEDEEAALDKGEEPPLYFRPRELRALFPAEVIEHMKTDPLTGASNRYAGRVPIQEPRRKPAFWERWWPSSPAPRTSNDEEEDALWRLPREHLPILVAARMSISFPILFSGVPLWAMERVKGGDGEKVFRRCIFSDGSLCSNFPIHLFDSWLPAWPTFGISMLEQVPDPDHAPRRRRFWQRDNLPRSGSVTLPDDHRAGRDNRWNNFDYEPEAFVRLFSFANAILSTTMSWGDATLARLPGVRDRVAEVELTPGTGGLNIRMTTEQIDSLAELGGDAGLLFLKRFAGRAPTGAGNMADGWNEHRWVRFNVLRDSLAAGLAGLTWSASQGRYCKSIPDLISDATREPPLAGDDASKIHAAHAAALEAVLNALTQAERALSRPTVNQPYVPSPRPVMRVRPPL